MTPKNGTTADLTITTESDPTSVDTTVDDSIFKRSTFETPEPSYHPSDYTS